MTKFDDTMNDMIHITDITIDNQTHQGVDARELHGFLESRRDFSNWITKAIEDYGFVENQDFVSFNKNVVREKGASVRTEYALTLDTAKELAMVSKSERGRQARQYFIECERQLREQRPWLMPWPVVAAQLFSVQAISSVFNMM